MTTENRAEGQPLAAPAGGPYVQQAFFCENVLQEGSIVSFIRQIDRITTTATGPEAPDRMPPTTYTAHLAVAFKSGDARGSHEVRVFRELPSGLRDPNPVLRVQVLFEGGDRGAGIIGQLTMTYEEEGLYWFDVYIDETLMTRIPFRIIYQRAMAGGPS